MNCVKIISMKIRGNVIAGTKLAWSAIRLNGYIAPIESAQATGDVEAERAALIKVCSDWVNWLMDKFDTTMEITGQENIPDGPCVFMGNHQGYCDAMAMLKAAEGKQVSFIAKDALRKVPLLGDWVLRSRGLLIPTNGDTRESLKVINKGVEYLKEGFSLVIFPEGKRSWGPEMNEFKPGSFKLATKAEVPIVPVTINGTYKIFEEHEKIMSGQHITVQVHPAIETKNMSKEEQKDLPDKVYKIIHDALPHVVNEQ